MTNELFISLGNGTWAALPIVAIPSGRVPGLFNPALAAVRAQRHEALFMDKYGQDLRIVGRTAWGQCPEGGM